MAQTTNRPADTWSPLYFLASVGAGGIAVTFFMYLMFWIPHPGKPVPVFEDVTDAMAGADAPLMAAIWLALAGIAVFGAMNLYLLVWNLRRSGAFAASDRGAALAATTTGSIPTRRTTRSRPPCP